MTLRSTPYLARRAAQFRGRFVRAVDVLARLLVDRHRAGDAVALCRRAVTRDQHAPGLASVVAAVERVS